VVFDGVLRQVEALGHVTVRKATRQEPQHLHLAFAEAGRSVPTRPRDAMPGLGQHRTDGVAIQSSGPRLTAQFDRCVVRRECRAMRSRFGHRVVHIGSCQDARSR